MNIALVDDNQTELNKLETCLADYAAIHQLEIDLQQFTDAESLLEDYRPLKYTVIFLDIFMNGMTGIEAAEQIRSKDEDTILVFLTTSDDHRADAFRCHAYDYLQKPYERDDVFRIMDYILRLHTEEDEKRLSFICDRKDYSLRYADLVYLETEKNYITIRDKFGCFYKVRTTFSTVKEQLSDDSRFLTILRGVIVNMDYVKNISDNTCLLDGEITLPITVRNSKSIRQTLHNYHFAKIRRETLQRGGQL